MPRYALFGVQLDSEPALHTLIEQPSGEDEGAQVPQIRIRLDASTGAAGIDIAGADVDAARLAAEGAWQQRYVLTFAGRDEPFMTVYQGPAGHRLRVHDRADFMVSADGRSIRCRAMGQTPWPTIEQLIIDQIVPRALQLMGRPCLHASAVCGPSGVIALLGEAGSGKSTLSAALCERDYALICDDCLALDLRARPIAVYPGYPSVRLWPDSAEALLGAQHQLPLASPRTDKLRKRYALADRTPPLACIICLTPDDNAETPRLQRLRAREGFAALTTALHRLTPQGAAILSAEFELLSAVAEHIPILRLHYRQDYGALDQLLDVVVAHPTAM